MDANVDTVQSVVKLMVSLYHLTNNIVTQVFGKKTRMDSVSHYSKEGRQNFRAVIENRNYKQWTELGPRSERFIVDAFRSFHPEARPKDVKDEFNKLITKNTSKSIDEQKEEDKIIRFVSQLNMFSVTNKMSGRPAINGKMATVNVGGSISPYRFETRLEQLDAFDYKIVFKNVSVINIDWRLINDYPYGFTKTKELLTLMRKYIPDCKKVCVNLDNNMWLYENYNGKTLDLTEGFPDDITVSYKILNRNSNWGQWSKYNYPIDYDVTVIDSKGPKVQHLSNNCPQT